MEKIHGDKYRQRQYGERMIYVYFNFNFNKIGYTTIHSNLKVIGSVTHQDAG